MNFTYHIKYIFLCVSFFVLNQNSSIAGKIDISKFYKAEVLMILFNASKAQGLGIFSAHMERMTLKEAESLIGSGKTYFDYIRGRVMKIDLGSSELDTYSYNRDNGEDKAEQALASLIKDIP